jgi:hypothetical protein
MLPALGISGGSVARGADPAVAPPGYTKLATWQETMLAIRAAWADVDTRFAPFVSGYLRYDQAPQKVAVKISGIDRLWFTVENEDPRCLLGSAVWGNARLVAKDGSSTSLSALKPVANTPENLEFRFGRDGRDRPLCIGETTFADGLWMGAGALCFKLDRKYERLEAQIGADTPSSRRHNVRVGVLNHREFTAWPNLERDFPRECDWFLQDLAACGLPLSSRSGDLASYPARWFSGTAEADLEQRLILKAIEELGPAAPSMRAELEMLQQSQVPPHSRAWLDLYSRVCQARRGVRLQALAGMCPALVFTKHANMGGSHYAYTEAQSDAQAERHFNPGGALCLLEMQAAEPHVRTLLEDAYGMIRDPDISYDGRRVLFAWKKSDRLDDFHLYEMELASGAIRQLTFGLGFADYEGAYLPNGDIIFNSTRCVQTVDCFTTEVSNLYTCDKDGRHLRRLGFDQVHTNYPTVTGDGRVLYTRWEYNDRGQIFPQALFQMNADGTGQSAFYGNNSWFPTTILHARNIPGTQKVLAIATGHHSRQVGKLIVLDPARGREENSGAQLVAPVRDTPAVHVDAFGQDGDLFQYPYPLSETQCLVTYSPRGWDGLPRPTDTGWDGRAPLFGIYCMTIDGRRELLASDSQISCNQPVPLHRPAPRCRPNIVDYAQNVGVYYVQDIYAGAGLAGVPRGTVKKLRVVALDFRAALLGGNGNGGPAGGAMVSTPVAVGNGCWDPKIVLGETPVLEDGSAQFWVPARTPLYFQAVDAKGYVVQTMRSWSTLQPGENASCVGCHESKNCVPPPYRASLAQRQTPRQLEPFYGPPRGFSFRKEIQPILDRHCTRCHNDRQKSPQLAAAQPAVRTVSQVPSGSSEVERSFSLLGEENLDTHSKRRWSDGYLALTGARPEARREAYFAHSSALVNWVSPQSAPPMLPPYSAGSATSGLMKLLGEGHKGEHLSQEELDKIACWIDLVIPYCGDYREANAWTPVELSRYDHFVAKRQQMAAIEAGNVRQYLCDNGRPNNAGVAMAGSGSEKEQVDLAIEVQNAKGSVLFQQRGKAAPFRPLVLDMPRRFEPGDTVRVRGAKTMAVQFDDRLGESVIFAPQGEFSLPIPCAAPGAKPRSTPYPPQAFSADRPRIAVRPVAGRELDAYRNLARNPYDVRGESKAFPHATSNSECRNEPVFAARNAIDGFKENRHHGGWPNQSWGPEQRKDLWWQVDFGREVEIDKLVITIRADFPHDKHWKHATLVFSDGGRTPINLEKTSAEQTFLFPPRKTTSVRLADLVQDEPLGWCALTEVEAWGRDQLPVAADLRCTEGNE